MEKLALILLLLNILLPFCVSKEFMIRETGEKEEGDNFSLTCIVVVQNYSIHTPFIWRKNTYVLPGQTNRMLRFEPLTREDTGVYDCRLDSPSYPEFSGSFSLDLRYRPEVHISLRINDSSDASRVQAGHTLLLTCNVTSAHPNVTHFSWWYSTSCDNIPSQTASPIRFSQHWKVPSVRSTDAGCYTCAAENEVNISNVAKKMINVDYLEHPCVIVDASVVEGDDTTINCTVDSSPTAILELVKNGDSLRTVEGNFISKTIKNITSEAAGNVSCRAWNNETLHSFSALTELRVNYKPRILSKGASQKVGARLGHPATLSLTFSAYPPPRITWKHHPDSKSTMTVTRTFSSHNETKLVFSEVEEEDLGSYCVDLQNDYGRVFYVFHLVNDSDSVRNTTSPSKDDEKRPGEDGGDSVSTNTTIPGKEKDSNRGDWFGAFIGVLVCFFVAVAAIVALIYVIWTKRGQEPEPEPVYSVERHEMEPLDGNANRR